MRFLQIVAGIIIGSIGLAITGFGVFLAIEPIDWMTRLGVLFGFTFFGLAVVFGGVQMARGEEVGEFFTDLFTSIR
jgi:hypothetical protein